jgi:hypothetical protein
MNNNISVDSKEWLGNISGKISIIVLNGIVVFLSSSLDPCHLKWYSPESALLIYFILSILISSILLYIYLVIKWACISKYGFLRIVTTVTNNQSTKEIGLNLFSKKKISLTDINVELTRFTVDIDSDLQIGQQNKLVLSNSEIAFDLPRKVTFVRGIGNQIELLFVDEKCPIDIINVGEASVYGDFYEFIIKVVGRFDNKKYEFSEYFKGKFGYTISNDIVIYINGQGINSGQIRWTQGYKKKLKRISLITEKIRLIKRIIPGRRNYCLNSLRIFLFRCRTKVNSLLRKFIAPMKQ